MCTLKAMAKEKHKNDVLFRIAGLLGVGMIGLLVMGCGLALAFGNYRLSAVLFFVVIGMLACSKLIIRFLH